MYSDYAQKQSDLAKCGLTCSCGGAYDGPNRVTLSPWGVGCKACGKLHHNSLRCWRQQRPYLAGNDLIIYGAHLLDFLRKRKK